MTLAEPYRNVILKVPKGVTLIAVSKTQHPDFIEVLYHMGQRDFGENYVQELLQKAKVLNERGCTGIRWHMIGPLQRNKVKALLPEIACLHTLDSERLADEIAKRKPTKPLPVFVQVNIDGETTKAGLPVSEVPEFCKAVASRDCFELLGLMCIPNPDWRRLNLENPFQALKRLEEKCRPHTQGKLSMGMSEDFEEAIQAGATHVRVGSAIFGARPQA